MPPINTGGFSEHLAPGLFAIVGTQLKSKVSFWRSFYNMRTTKRNYEDVLAATGLPMAVAKGEGDPIVSEDALEGDTKRISPEEWGIGAEITQTAWEDDLYSGDGSALRDAATGIADSLNERKEVEAHRFFTTGFETTTFTVLPDSSAMFATSHVPITGGEAAAQVNREDVDFSVSSMRDALIRFENYTNDRGIRIPDYAKPKGLVASPSLRYTIDEVLKSSMRPDTANDVENVTRNALTSFITPYITDTNAWFIFAQKHFNDFFMRSGPRFDNFDERRRRVAVFLGWERYIPRAYHWLGWHGSQGS